MADNKLLLSLVIFLGSLFLLPSLALASLPADLEPDGDPYKLWQNRYIRWIRANINVDGAVNLLDFNLLVENFGNSYTIFDYNTLVENFGK